LLLAVAAADQVKEVLQEDCQEEMVVLGVAVAAAQIVQELDQQD
jgi:hypothetical protein